MFSTTGWRATEVVWRFTTLFFIGKLKFRQTASLEICELAQKVFPTGLQMRSMRLIKLLFTTIKTHLLPERTYFFWDFVNLESNTLHILMRAIFYTWSLATWSSETLKSESSSRNMTSIREIWWWCNWTTELALGQFMDRTGQKSHFRRKIRPFFDLKILF